MSQLERLKARRKFISDEEILRLRDSEGRDALAIARWFGATALRFRRRNESPWDKVAQRTIYAFKRSATIEAFSAAADTYSVIVVTSGLLSKLQICSPLLALLEHFRAEGQGEFDRDSIGSLLSKALDGTVKEDTIEKETELAFSILSPEHCERVAKLAGAYLEFMVVFVLEHEWSHIINGHLEISSIRDDNTGRSVLDQTFWKGPGNLLRTLEISADVHALVESLHMMGGRLAGWTNNYGLSNDLAIREFSLSTAIPVIFLLQLDTLKPTQFEAMRWSDHPPGFYRFALMSDYLGLWLLGGFPSDGFGNPEVVRVSREWIERFGFYHEAVRPGLLDRSENGEIYFPTAEQFAEYKVNHSFGLHRWPNIKKLCAIALVSRVAGPEAVERLLNEWNDDRIVVQAGHEEKLAVRSADPSDQPSYSSDHLRYIALPNVAEEQ